jgi:hypothetical protein
MGESGNKRGIRVPSLIMHCYFSKYEFEDLLWILALGTKNPKDEDWFRC